MSNLPLDLSLYYTIFEILHLPLNIYPLGSFYREKNCFPSSFGVKNECTFCIVYPLFIVLG